MQYLLMCYFDEKAWAEIPQAKRDELMQEYGVFVKEAAAEGHYVGGAKLEASSAATTVRSRQGKPVISDGPFAETKEQLGGYHLVECSDLDAALALARRIPTLRVGGTVEVRPLAWNLDKEMESGQLATEGAVADVHQRG